MFKLESYITPIILSYVDKYIKNFRPQDSQVSLWGGDASFHNLDLRLEVLEQELQLPFSFVSGHIHELLIHVPWTKLAAEPITITINTIECILKLPGSDESHGAEKSGQLTEKAKKVQQKRQHIETPSGYLQLLINKIVSNIRIYCNNLILKYVEEDIVLSMNVKLLTFESANEKWEPAYTDVSPSQILLRKLIAVNDLTVCLDKRNASGKIDVYQEPMLYRCSMIIHLLRSDIPGNTRSSTMRLDVFCNSMEFSMTEQQIPMLVRLIHLLQALHQKQFKSDIDIHFETDPMIDNNEYGLEKQTLAGWAWSFVPSILPMHEDEIDAQYLHNLGPTTHMGFYVDNASLTFKVSESSNDKGGYYSQKKIKYWPLLTLKLQGIFMDSIFHGKQWSQVSLGISEMILVPIGQCSCSVQDVFETTPVIEYLKAGTSSSIHKSDSLFDAEAPENKGNRKIYNTNWDHHIETTNEAALLERSPAFAFDYLYQLIVPDDMSSENLSELGSDLEYSNLSERALMRTVIGPLKLKICSGFLHRLSSLQAAASAYDYSPYSVPKPDPERHELPPASEDDYDALNENIPTRVTQLTVLAPVVELCLMDHPFYQASKGNLFRKRKKMPTHCCISNLTCKDLPKITYECQCIDLKLTHPMYVKRLVRTTCQLPDPPNHMFEACHTDLSIKIIGFFSRLIIGARQTTVLTPTNGVFVSKQILTPQYWTDPNTAHNVTLVECESMTITGTYPKMIIYHTIITKFLKRDVEDAVNFIHNSSILQDASKSQGLVYLEFFVEGFKFVKVTTCTTIAVTVTLSAMKTFVMEPIAIPVCEVLKSADVSLTPSTTFYSTREIQQVLILSGPECENFPRNASGGQDAPLLKAVFQFPRNPEEQSHAPLLFFAVREMRICVDPLLCKWLLYTPKSGNVKTEVLYEPSQRKLSRSYSDNSAYETPRRSRTPYESVHSSLEHATYVTPTPNRPCVLHKDTESECGTDLQESTYNFLKRWFEVWKGMLLYGDIAQCTIYFPVQSLSAVDSQGIQQAIEMAMKMKHPPDLLVVCLPSVTIRNAIYRDNLQKYSESIPVQMPDNLWNKNKSSFPWHLDIAGFSCVTWQNGLKINCLSSTSLTSTVGMSTKTDNKSEQKTNDDYKSMENIININFSGNKNDISTFGVCVHIDMTPILITISESQLCLIASILHGLIEVVFNILPENKQEPLKIETIPQMSCGNQRSSNASPTITIHTKESVDSVSERLAHVSTELLDNHSIKLMAWIQWTISRFTIEMLAHGTSDRTSKSRDVLNAPKLKFVIDAEDIVSSLDFQNVYLKLKSKIGSASVMHYIMNKTHNWIPGDFLGFVLRANEDPAQTDRQEDTSFASITITRASCQHTHSLWGTKKNQKSMQNDKDCKDDKKDNPTNSRYMTEIVLTLQPIDILLSPTTLKNYFLVLEPLMQIPSGQGSKTRSSSMTSFQISNITLPLTYIEFNGFRVIMPSADLETSGSTHNTCVFQIKRINLTPTAENPICRTPCRPDIYQQAAQSRILNVPGSDIEDRQYQLDIRGICMNTGSWTEISQVLRNSGKSVSILRTMSENPALEWNSLGKGKLSSSPGITYWPIISKFDISLVFAPAMLYKSDVICGHSIEVNFISDINFNISLDQIKLVCSLLDETQTACNILLSVQLTRKTPSVIFPYAYLLQDDIEINHHTETAEATRDSGIETSDLRSTTFSLKTKESVNLRKMSDVSEKSGFIVPCPSFGKSFGTVSAGNYIPVEVLITGGNISIVLYEFERKKLRESTKTYDGESDKGYEASEESSVDEKSNYKHFVALMYFSISQPNAFLSDTLIGKKIQVSCYDISVKINGAAQKNLKGIPSKEDFDINLLETKSGQPNVDTGVLPAFFTFKWSKCIGKPATLNFDIAKPTKFVFSMSRWHQLQIIQTKLMHNVSRTISLNENTKHNVETLYTKPFAKVPHKSTSDHYVKFELIKEKFLGVTVINVNIEQVMISMQLKTGVEVTLAFSRLRNQLTLNSRPEKLLNLINIECLTLGTSGGTCSKLILNPWSMSIEILLFWESWQHTNSNPQVQLSAESESIVLDISPDKILYLQALYLEMKSFLDNYQSEAKSKMSKHMEPTKSVPTGEREQHYKDDLRAGAFHFVDSNSNNIDELPMPYQVVFWNRNISAMAWRYPQPRALTKVRIFPVPFKISTGNEEDQQILCHLEYWSDCHGCYQAFTQFYLSETDILHLELPKSYPQPAVACTWRVVLTTPSVKDYNQSRVLISPRALAGCIRIDSYFNKSLIPQLTLALQIASINVNFFNYFDARMQYRLPDVLQNYSSMYMYVPEYQQFLVLSIDNAKAFLATWKFQTAIFDMNCTSKCTILDYGFLTQQILVEPFSSKIEISLSKTIGINYISQPIHVNFGAGAAHTLAVSLQMWTEILETPIAKLLAHCEDTTVDFVPMTRYVICNDTNINLRFGQAGFEDIFLPSRFFHLYSWRSQKSKQLIRVALEENRWVWSEPFRIDCEGIEMYKMMGDNAVIIVTVRSLSSTQKLVVFSGQLIICNTLLEHFEMKIFRAGSKDKENELKTAQSNVIRGKSTPPSMLIDNDKNYYMRIRFYGLESAWSGDIPLMENTKCAQPWLVKVPLQERGQFLSIWCRIVVQRFPKGRKMLAMFWPLFMIRSNLPISAKVNMETPTLGVNLESTVKGFGEYQQLYCPGTIDHSHQLTFQLDSAASNSNPYVPLNYSLVDQKQFFKKPEKDDVDEILEIVNNFDKKCWSYFKDDYEDVEFISEDQPLTHVQVHYQNACPHSSALLVELLPWSLMINTLGCPIAIIVNEKELCRVVHNGMVTPPKLDDTFCLGIGIGGTWNVSSSLQLAKSNWSQSFYMPSITGTIPIEGTIRTAVLCEPYICVASISSTIYNQIRLLKITSSHVITNHLEIQVNVMCFAVPEAQKKNPLPKYFECFSLILPAYMNKTNSAFPITQWFHLIKKLDTNVDSALYISFATDAKNEWSCPLRVDKVVSRRSVAITYQNYSIPIVLVSQEHKGQIHLSVHHDKHPQLHVENQSGTKLYCAQFGNESGIVKDCEHFEWVCSVDDGLSSYYSMPFLKEKFPELSNVNAQENLVLASDPDNDPQGFLWSTPVNIANINDQFVRIPFYGDVKISIKYSVHTTKIFIESVSQVEISAQDIRVRLSLHENEAKRKELTGSESSTTFVSTYFSAEESISSASTENLRVEQRMSMSMPARERNIRNLDDVDDFAISLQKERCTSMRIVVFLKRLIFTLTSDLENGGAEKTEIASLTCDNLALTLARAKISQISVGISAIQVDNQLHYRGSYDFPVILIAQDLSNRDIAQNFNLNATIMQLINGTMDNCLLKMDMNVESWPDPVLNKWLTGVKDIKIRIEPLSVFIEDTYMTKLKEYLSVLTPENLVLWTKPKPNQNYKISPTSVQVPSHIIFGASMLAQPICLKHFTVDEISILLSVHSSLKVYIALDQSPLQFAKFDKRRLFTTYYRLGHAMTMHYLSGAIFGAGWVVGSLELLGSPGGLARSMGTGLRDFVSLPYHGFLKGPWAFLWGVSYGSASLMKHVTAGTLQSITKLASSVARNLDRLTLDEEHLRRTEESRRQRPQGLTQGFVQGMTGFGISLLGAVGGIAHHPLQSVMNDGVSPRALVSGVGRGIVGVFTKPLSGAAELLALTGEGLLQGAGWNVMPEPRLKPVLNHIFSTPNSMVKYKWKFIELVTQSNILFVTEATAISNASHYDAVALVLTTEALVIVDIDEDMPRRVLSLSDLSGVISNDPTLLSLKLEPPRVSKIVEDDVVLEMDPACRARVVDFVRNTVGLMQLPSESNVSPDHSEMSISPDVSPAPSPSGGAYESTVLTFYVNPESRNYFLCLLTLAKQQIENHSFNVL